MQILREERELHQSWHKIRTTLKSDRCLTHHVADPGQARCVWLTFHLKGQIEVHIFVHFAGLPDLFPKNVLHFTPKTWPITQRE